MKNTTPLGLSAALVLLLAGNVVTAWADRATVADDAIWVHDELYGTVATVTAFKSPPPHSTDVIFSFMDSGLMGQRSVAVYAPGDPEYNGGRWNVMLVTFTSAGIEHFDTDGDWTVDTEITNAEDLMEAVDQGYLTISKPGVYFECPLRPNRGRGHERDM